MRSPHMLPLKLLNTIPFFLPVLISHIRCLFGKITHNHTLDSFQVFFGYILSKKLEQLKLQIAEWLF